MDNITPESSGNPSLHDYGNIDIRVKATGVEPSGNPEMGDCGAMDKCCGNCGFWGVDGFPEDEGLRLPDFGEGFALCGGAKWVQARTTDWPDEAMSVIDADGYSADLITRKDHYCSAWEHEK